MVPGLAAGLMMIAGTMQAQPPRQSGQGRYGYNPGAAQQACDAAASRNGYQVMRRDRETMNGNTYNLPMHVSHAGTEADVTCQYDPQRNVAMVPRWDDQNRRPGGYDRDDRGHGDRDDRGHGDRDDRGYADRDRDHRGGQYSSNGQYSSMDQQVETMCQNYISQSRGYQILNVGTPTRHGRNQYDVPVTVRRNGRREMTMTCRYNAASNKLSLR